MSQTHSRRAVLAGIAAAPALAAPALALSGTGPDPIFALIEQYRVAYAHRDQAIASGDDGEIEVASDASKALEIALARTRPTTLAGILAIMRYERELRDQPDELRYDLFDFEPNEEPVRGTIRGWLATIEQSIAAIAGVDKYAALPFAAPAIAPDPSADAELIELGRELAIAIGDHKAAKARVFSSAGEGVVRISYSTADYEVWNAAARRAYDLTDAIVAMPARTIAGLGAKAVAALWAMSSESDCWQMGGDTCSEQGGVQLVEAVAALAGMTLPPHESPRLYRAGKEVAGEEGAVS
jgi:hypothetical protein